MFRDSTKSTNQHRFQAPPTQLTWRTTKELCCPDNRIGSASSKSSQSVDLSNSFSSGTCGNLQFGRLYVFNKLLLQVYDSGASDG